MPSKKNPAASTATEETAPPPLPIGLDVRINSIVPDNGGKLRATASVGMNGCFAVRGVKVYDGPKGLFVNMPSYKARNGEFKDYCHPVTKGFREQLNNAVLDAYRQAAQGQTPAKVQPDPSPMQVDVRITVLTPNSENQRASATVNLNGSFALKGVKVMEGSNGLFVHTPSYKSGGEFKEHYFPTTKEFREQLHNSVLTAYDGAIAQSQAAAEQDHSEPQGYTQTM
jgi:stage V sporulation protein G